MFAAYAEGNLDEMFTFIHPDITWMPLTRPGRTLYVGHEATMELLQDNSRALGEFRLDWDEFTMLSDGRVVCPGQIVVITGTGETLGQRFECALTFRDGLVVELASRPRSGS